MFAAGQIKGEISHLIIIEKLALKKLLCSSIGFLTL